MDFSPVITRNREALLQIVATLFAMIGLVEGKPVNRLSWPLHRAVLRILRPAEAAVRRLIVVAARGLVLRQVPQRPAPAGLGPATTSGKRTAFRLFDPRQSFNQHNAGAPRPTPRIHVFDLATDPRIPLFHQALPAPPAPGPEPPLTVTAAPLCRRLAAVRYALENLGAQARRYARWRAKPFEQRCPKHVSALRPGAPPGFRKHVPHRVHAVLNECHFLARVAEKPDTS